MKKIVKVALFLLLNAWLLSSAQALTTFPQSALVPSTDYYTNNLGTAAVMTGGGNAANIGGTRNDDGFSGPINLGFTLNFFGGSYTQFWANNNGSISFAGGISQHTPLGPQGLPQPLIGIFFADVDTRSALSGLMYLRNDIANQIIVTWDSVGYYELHGGRLNSFQLVLRGPGYAVPPGEGQIGFYYKKMEWETGDASGGSGGFGVLPAAVGLGDGVANGYVLAGSFQNGIAAAVSNQYIWFNLNDGSPPEPISDIPEPSTWALCVGGLTALLLSRVRVR